MGCTIDDIGQHVRGGGRLTAEDARLLWEKAPLWMLGELASERKRRVSGDKVYYNRNFHIEPTNVCLFECRFCSYRRAAGEEGAWDYSMDEVMRMVEARRESGATEVHIVGGVHPTHDLYYYAEMIRRIKQTLPEVCIKAFTAVELRYIQSESHKGEAISSVHGDLLYLPISFSDIDFSDIDVLFLCLGHGNSAKFLAENPVPECGKDYRFEQRFSFEGRCG